MHAQQTLDFGHAGFGQSHRAAFLVDRVIALGFDGGAVFLRRIALNHRAPLQLRNHPVDEIVLIRRLLRRSGNNQRRSRFVDQYIIDFVDDDEVELALDILFQGEFHIVAQIVEAELVIGAVGDIGEVSLLAGDRPQIQDNDSPWSDERRIEQIADLMHDGRHGESQLVIDRPHPLHVAPRQVIVDGDQMSAPAGERIQI